MAHQMSQLTVAHSIVLTAITIANIISYLCILITKPCSDEESFILGLYLGSNVIAILILVFILLRFKFEDNTVNVLNQSAAWRLVVTIKQLLLCVSTMILINLDLRMDQLIAIANTMELFCLICVMFYYPISTLSNLRKNQPPGILIINRQVLVLPESTIEGVKKIDKPPPYETTS